MIVASSDKEWLQWPIEILVLETVLNHLKLHYITVPQFSPNLRYFSGFKTEIAFTYMGLAGGFHKFQLDFNL